MFIPPNRLKDSFEARQAVNSYVRLKSSHLLIDQEIASVAFGEENNVYVIYYPDRNSLMIAPVSDKLFKSLHKAGQQMLKDRNLKGDKSIALHEILIDNQLDEKDRDLTYDFQAAMGILNIEL